MKTVRRFRVWEFNYIFDFHHDLVRSCKPATTPAFSTSIIGKKIQNSNQASSMGASTEKTIKNTQLFHHFLMPFQLRSPVMLCCFPTSIGCEKFHFMQSWTRHELVIELSHSWKQLKTPFCDALSFTLRNLEVTNQIFHFTHGRLYPIHNLYQLMAYN